LFQLGLGRLGPNETPPCGCRLSPVQRARSAWLKSPPALPPWRREPFSSPLGPALDRPLIVTKPALPLTFSSAVSAPASALPRYAVRTRIQELGPLSRASYPPILPNASWMWGWWSSIQTVRAFTGPPCGIHSMSEPIRNAHSHAVLEALGTGVLRHLNPKASQALCGNLTNQRHDMDAWQISRCALVLRAKVAPGLPPKAVRGRGEKHQSLINRRFKRQGCSGLAMSQPPAGSAPTAGPGPSPLPMMGSPAQVHMLPALTPIKPTIDKHSPR